MIGDLIAIPFMLLTKHVTWAAWASVTALSRAATQNIRPHKKKNYTDKQTRTTMKAKSEDTEQQHAHQSTSSTARNHRRRGNRTRPFGAELTHPPNHPPSNSHPGPSYHRPRTSANPRPTINYLDSLSLCKRLAHELSNSTYDCAICITPVRLNQQIYHCPHCYAVFHLPCASKWASRSVAESSSKAILLRDRDLVPSSPESIRGVWRCPGCQHPHSGPDTIPRQNRCWCQKNIINAHHRSYTTKFPHGCGSKCGRISALGCVHHCDEYCHPGPCPPCTALVQARCHCQKVLLPIRCSQLYTTRTIATYDISKPEIEHANHPEELSCKNVCRKTLSCGIHWCQKTCHPGPCDECQVVRDKSCYCGRTKLIEEKCGHRIDFEDPMMAMEARKNQDGKIPCVSSDGSSEWVGEFRCGERCEWKYACGIHTCSSTCHPHATIQPCPYSPQLIKSCPCGSTPLEDSCRKSCSDPIPTCQNICGKPFESCSHPCPSTCHLGPCPKNSCKASVTTSCRCGKDKIIRECKEIERLKKESLMENYLVRDEAEREEESIVTIKAIEYRCERKCRVLRSCGKHACNRTCCPLSFLESFLYQKRSNQNSDLILQDDPEGLHTCTLVCNKKLSCGSHSCQLQDHKGPCPPCLLASFDPLYCHCGSTVIEPPVRCGTRIKCEHNCVRGRGHADCGHPIIPHQCHEEPDCPPCVYLTSKPCQCAKKNMVQNVRCSQPTHKISCAQKCNNLLGCGAHRCQLICHPVGLCQPCDQVCLKPRKHCGHGCLEKCHAPTACKTEEGCEAMITIKCKCGHCNTSVKCASSDEKPEGNRQQTIECTQECDLIRRNLQLMEALEISKPSASVLDNTGSRPLEYSSTLLKFFKSHTGFAKTIESQLDRFLSPPLDTSPNSSSSSLIISTCSKLKQNFLVELVGHYQIKFLPPLGQEPKFNVKLMRDSKSSKPTKLLSEAYGETEEEETEKVEIKNGRKPVIDSKHVTSFEHQSSNRFNILSSSSSTNHKVENNQPRLAWLNSGPRDRHLGQVISGGYNKPPIAVVAPIGSTSHFHQSPTPSSYNLTRHADDSDVVEDWEDQV